MEVTAPKTSTTNSDANESSDLEQEEGGEGDIGGVEVAEGDFYYPMKQKEIIPEDIQNDTQSSSSETIFCGNK